MPPDPDPLTATNARLHVVLRGVVQGVGFRYFVRREALRALISGWVANAPDGSLEVVAEGDPSALDRFLERVSVGPPGAIVRDIDLQWLDPTGEFDGFGVRARGHSGD